MLADPFNSNKEAHIILVAGESSGDILGASLMRGLRELFSTSAKLRFSGIGGPEMEKQGMVSIVPMTDLSLMGFAEVLPNIFRLLKHLKTIEEHTINDPASVIVTIDSPGFNFRLAQRLKSQPTPIVHYVAPQIWAWRKGRAKKLSRIIDHLLTLLPFEPSLFVKEGLPATFVGHPVIESGAQLGNGLKFREKYHIPSEVPLLAVLPGRRRGEVQRLIKPFGDTVNLLAKLIPDLQVVIPTSVDLYESIDKVTKKWDVPIYIILGKENKFDSFVASDAALAASGTVTLELAISGVPMVTAYRLNPLTWGIVSRIVYAKYINLINIISNKLIIPELIQGSCDPRNILPALENIFMDQAERQKQLHAFSSVIKEITPNESPSIIAAKVIVKVMKDGSRKI